MPLARRNILIVDDSPEDRIAFRRYLSSDPEFGYYIAEADLGEEALEHLHRSRQASFPDCLLVDINLPDIDGITLLAELGRQFAGAGNKENGPLPVLPFAVVMLTGSGDETAAVAAIQAGAQNYLVKGRLNASELRYAVNNACEKADLTRRLQESEARLRLATEAAGIGTWELSPQNGEIRGDSRFRALHDLPETGPLDYPRFLRQVHAADREAVQQAIRAVENSGGSDRESVEYRVNSATNDGGNAPARWVQWFGQASSGGGLQAARILGTVMDVTDRKTSEEERSRHVARQERVAEAVQRSLLLVPPPDSYPGMTVVTQYKAAWDEALIGGDFFDVFAVAEGKVALLIGDATGKGVQAATYTAEIKFALRAILRECGGSPAAALNRLNNFIIDNSRLDPAHVHESFTAAALAILDTSTGVIHVSNAGSEPPLILRNAATRGGETYVSTVRGPLLGVEDALPYEEEQLVLELGDLFVMTTDGITESRSPRSRTEDGQRLGGVFLDLDGLAAVVRDQTAALQAASLTANGLTAVGSAAVAHTLAWSRDRQHDDICLMLACRR